MLLFFAECMYKILEGHIAAPVRGQGERLPMLPRAPPPLIAPLTPKYSFGHLTYYLSCTDSTQSCRPCQCGTKLLDWCWPGCICCRLLQLRWKGRGSGPRMGHFCLVGLSQQLKFKSNQIIYIYIGPSYINEKNVQMHLTICRDKTVVKSLYYY